MGKGLGRQGLNSGHWHSIEVHDIIRFAFLKDHSSFRVEYRLEGSDTEGFWQ